MLEKIKKVLYRHINTKEINYKTLEKMMKQKDVVLIDVRSKQEYNEGHLIGAICISLYEIEKNITKVVPNKESIIILYCSSGARSKQAQELLEQLGYDNVYNLKGGLNNI